MKKKILFLIGLIINSLAIAQVNNHIMLGNSRHYGDSIVLRWNGNSAYNFLHIYHSKIIIQRKTAEEKKYTTVSEQSAYPLENWGNVLEVKNQQVITAAAGLQNLLKTENAVYNSIEKQLEASQTNQYLWQLTALAADINIQVATALNLRFIDKNIEKNKLYNYKVFAVNNDNSIKSDTLFFNIGNILYKPLNLTIPSFREGEKKVEITCPTNSQFSAYYIQKYNDKKSNFNTLNQSPLLGLAKSKGESAIIYIDTLLQNYIPAQYRIFAIDMFGNPSNYTEPITAMGRDRTPPPFATGLKITENANKTLTLQWSKIENTEGQIGVDIGLTHFNELAYLPVNNTILPLSVNSYTIDINPKYNDYYFELKVYDTAGNYSVARAYYLLLDSTGPGKPQNFKAVVDKKGVVKLSWNWNKEKDLDGYLIYFSNSKNTEFSGIVNVPLYDTLFYDTLSLQLLNKNVYYRIQAVDFRFNKSPISDIVKVTRPDTIKPASPFISKYTISDTAIVLKWIPSSSTDVVNHQLIKMNLKSGKIDSFLIQIKDTNYIDNKAIPDIEYKYTIIAVDDCKNISPPSNIVYAKTYKNVFVNAVKIITATYDSVTNSNLIQWHHFNKDIVKIQIFKGDSAHKLILIPTQIKPTENQYIDDRIFKNKSYFYAIKLYFKDGTQTRMSDPVVAIKP